MYWFFVILGGIILAIFLYKRSVDDVRNERKSNLPITDISVLQDRFKNQQWDFSDFLPAKMTILTLISPNGGAMSWFPSGEIDINIGVPSEIKNYINNKFSNIDTLPRYIAVTTFNSYTESGPYLMVDFYSSYYNKTLSIGFLNQQAGYDLQNTNLANLFQETIKKELENLK